MKLKQYLTEEKMIKLENFSSLKIPQIGDVILIANTGTKWKVCEKDNGGYVSVVCDVKNEKKKYSIEYKGEETFSINKKGMLSKKSKSVAMGAAYILK